MPRRILLADDPGPVVTAVGRDLERRGCEVEAVAPAEAVDRAASGRFDAALVHATRRAAGVVAALRAADPSLPIVVLFLDRKRARAGASSADGADCVLVGPVAAPAVGAVLLLAGKLRDAVERAGEGEAKRTAPGGHGAADLAFLKRLLLVEVKRSKRYGYPLSLALVEVDGWRAFGSKLSSSGRTALLAEVLGVVSASLRDIDLAVPFSGERIIVLMPHTKAEGGVRAARRLCATVRERGTAPALTVSVGVATHRGEGTVSFGSLVKRAGEALEKAIAAGGDRAEAAEPVKKRDRISIG